jgi:hypothetical protein
LVEQSIFVFDIFKFEPAKQISAKEKTHKIGTFQSPFFFQRKLKICLYSLRNEKREGYQLIPF